MLFKYLAKFVFFIFVLCSVIQANVFNVNVNISHTRENPDSNIKEEAFVVYSKQAFKSMLYKLVLQADEDKIDNLVEIADISKLIYSFNINNEDVGRNTYKANVVFTFNQNLLADFLNDNGVRFADSNIEKDYLVVPYFTYNNALAENYQWNSLFEQNSDSFLSNLIYYSFNSFLQLNPNQVSNLLTTLGVSDIFLVQLNKSSNVFTDSTGNATSVDYLYDINIKSVSSNKNMYSIKNVSNITSGFYKAIFYLEAKDRTAVASNKISAFGNLYYLTIKFNSLIEVEKIKQTLLQNGFSKNIVVYEFGNKYVNIQIQTTENISSLTTKLQSYCILLDNKNMLLQVNNICNEQL